MRGLGRALTVSVFLSMALALVSAEAWASPAMEQLRSTVDEVISILSNPSLKQPGQQQHRRQLLEQVIYQRFDYGEMAKRSLSGYWQRLSASQRGNFLRIFKELLERSYVSKLEAYTNEKIIYKSERQDDSYAEIRTMFVRRNDQIPINYRMINKDGKWWVYDVVIEGVSLVSNYRSQFGRIIRHSSYQELVRRMEAKLKEQQSIEQL